MEMQEEEVVFERYFLVDYENVNKDGLNGITKLNAEDCVRIYYSNAAETLTFGLHKRIIESDAHFDYIKVQMPIKNAVDCQILFDIRDLIKMNKQAEYFIVSKDTDFDKAIDEFVLRNIKVKKVLEICKLESNTDEPKQQRGQSKKQTSVKVSIEKREAQIRSWYGRNCKKKIFVDNKENIIQVLLNSTTKQQVNNGLLKLFPNETVSMMLKTLQPVIKDLPGK